MLCYALVIRSLKTKSRHVILRKHFNHVKQSIWLDTLPKVMDVAFPPGLRQLCKWDRSDFYVVFPNGSEIWIGGLDDKDRVDKILGKEYSTIFFNECSEISYESMCVALTRLSERTGLSNKAFFDCNPPKRAHWTYKLWHEYLNPSTGDQVDKDDYLSILMNPDDNRENIADGYIENTLDKLPPHLRDRFRFGVYGYDDRDIFKPDWVMPSDRIPSQDDIAAVFSFCDPAITEKERAREHSCESAIVTMGLCYDGMIHEIETLHGMWSYKELKETCKSVCDRYKSWKEFFFGVEDVAFQKALGSDLEELGVRVDYLRPDTDKVRRAISITDVMESGKVKVNSLALRRQLLEFPGEKLKDLVDAFVYSLKLYKIYAKDQYTKPKDIYKGLDGVSKDFWKAHFDSLNGKKSGGIVELFKNNF